MYAQQLTYRPEIDGLRFLAVMPVVLFHSKLPGFSGGFVGVDIFFVISGFLITRLIAFNMAEKNFSGWDFYERRIRRLLPPLIPVLIASVIMAMLTFSQTDFESFVRSLWATLGLHANWYFLGDVGYFDGPAHTKALLHMWSLAIEEQFYLVTPFVLLLLISQKKAIVIGFFATALLASFVFAQYLINSAQADIAFFNSLARIWELLVGVCLALLIHFKIIKNHMTGHAGIVARIIGLALIIGSIAFYTSETPFPGMAALPPVLGTALLIAAGRGEDFISNFLCLSPILFVGTVSYGFYLWHWPAIVFSNIWFPDAGLIVSLAAVVSAFLLSVLSYYIIETPIRKRRFMGGRTSAYASLIVSIIAVGALGTLGVVDGPIRQARLQMIYGNSAHAVENVAKDKSEYLALVNRNYTGKSERFSLENHTGFTCSLDKKNSPDRIMECLSKQASDETVLIFGDSVGRDAMYALRSGYPDLTFLMVHQSGCPPTEAGECFPGLEGLMDRIKTEIDPEKVILASRFKTGEYEVALEGLNAFTSRFESVSMLGVMPHHNGDIASVMNALDAAEDIPITHANMSGKFGHLNTWRLRKRLKPILGNQNVAFIDVTEFFCETDRCRLWQDHAGGHAMFWDRSHMTLPAIKDLGSYIAENELLKAEPIVVEPQDTFSSNLELLEILNQIILKEGVPVSPKMQDINKSLPELLKRYKLSNIQPETPIGLIGYRSDGTSYKLLMYDTGDCAKALIAKPDLVDRKPGRYKSGSDCRAYGFWTKGIAERF